MRTPCVRRSSSSPESSPLRYTPWSRRVAPGPGARSNAWALRPRSSAGSPYLRQGTHVMADLAFILLTVAIFVLLGLVVKAVERL